MKITMPVDTITNNISYNNHDDDNNNNGGDDDNNKIWKQTKLRLSSRNMLLQKQNYWRLS